MLNSNQKLQIKNQNGRADTENDQILQKLKSFVYYLKLVDMNEFAKWQLLNQIVEQEHPKQFSLEMIIKKRFNSYIDPICFKGHNM
jgi:hypothetical protein